MKEKILFCAYRDWAKEIFKNLPDHEEMILCESIEEFKGLDSNDFSLCFFVGWSWIVPNEWTDSVFCVCLHPSPLPKYRGGSPIQNQILNGEKWSAVSLFKMDNTLDGGLIISQQGFSLEGTLEDIFSRVSAIGCSLIFDVITQFGLCNEKINLTKQTNKDSTYFERRTPDMSEIEIEDFSNFTARELYDKIRCLQFPYPLPFIRCKNNTILYIKECEYENDNISSC